MSVAPHMLPIFMAIFFLLFGTAQIRAEEAEITALTILADPSLVLPLSQITSEYSADKHLSISVHYLPSFEQKLQIEEGVAADMIITAHRDVVTSLQQQGMVDAASIQPVAADYLVLIGKAGEGHSKQHAAANKSITAREMLSFKKERGFTLAVALPNASAEGFYTEQWLSDLRRKRIYLNQYLVQLQHAEEIAAFVAENGGYGVVLEGDALAREDMQVVGLLPKQGEYTAAVVVGKQMKAARKLLRYLKESTRASASFLKYGYQPVP